MKKTSVLRAIFSSIYFNFKYLPFRQAVKLPILLYKPKFKVMRGKVVIECKHISFGMIRLGFEQTLQYPNCGITWYNKGEIKFKGRVLIGNASSISCGKNATIIFGANFENNAAAKIISENEIIFDEYVSLGWDVTVMDTSFHPIIDRNTNKVFDETAPIHIGNHNWFGTKCTVLKGVITPPQCIFGYGSLLTKPVQCEPYSLLAGTPPTVKRVGVYRDFGDNKNISNEESVN